MKFDQITKNSHSIRDLRLAALSLGALWALLGCGGADHDPKPTVATAAAIRGSFELAGEGDAEPVAGLARVEEGATARTGEDGRGTLTLDSGAWILLDRSTELSVQLDRVVLRRGRIWIDAAHADETSVEMEGKGSVSASGATFAAAHSDAGLRVYCGSGELTYRSEGGSDRLQQGESVTLSGGGEPEVSPEEIWDDWTGGLADPARSLIERSTYLGRLAGRRIDQLGEARSSLPVRSHEVNVELRSDLAITEVVQTFFNARSDVLEGEYLIRMPHGAIVQSFAVDTGMGFQDGVVNATQVGQGYALSWLDAGTNGSRLTYDGPDRLRARIYPVSPGATVRVRLRYTQWLEREGKRRTYVYPMRADGEPPLLGEFILQVDTRRTSVAGLRAGMGARVENNQVVLRQSDFRPRADFFLDIFDPEEPSQEQTRAYVIAAPEAEGGDAHAEGDEHYVLFDIPTGAMGEAPTEEAPLELVMLLDVSGATDPEDLEIGRAVVESVLRQLAPTDRVTLRLADVTAHPPEGAPEELSPANEETREAILESISRVHLGGATDLAHSLRDAAETVAGRPRAAVLYLGDGLPTTGPLDATSIRASLSTLDSPPRFFALAIGEGSNIPLLRVLFGENAEAVHDRTQASRAVMRILQEAASPTLRGVRIDLGESIERVYPSAPFLVEAGQSLRLIGRLAGDLPQRITVTGTRDGQPFEKELSVHLGSIDDSGDVRRRWAERRLAELIDEEAGREAQVELGVRFSLVSPWTSLVVGGSMGSLISPILGFDRDPLTYAWGLAGGAPTIPVYGLTSDESGWRRRLRREAHEEATAPDRTWVPRVTSTAPEAAPRRTVGGGGSADGGLARAAVESALKNGERGPRGCYERRTIVRPDLRGDVDIEVAVDGQGGAQSVRVTSTSLSDDDLVRCIETEVRGLRFPATGGSGQVTVTHRIELVMPEREFGNRRRCSDASQQSLEVRRDLWRERLAANQGVNGALSVWREARGQCEVGTWSARRSLLSMMLRHAGSVPAQVALYRAFRGSPSIAVYLRRAILRRVRTPEDVLAIRAGLGLDVPLDWSLFNRLWWADRDPQARLRLVRRWLEVAPDEMDLRLRLLSLLEETEGTAEARRLARELRADPLADARVRTAIGEFWLRQGDEAEARRVFSEIVERAPLDPWARRRLGDLYRAHEWADDAYREYNTLARLRPGQGEVLLLLSRAAAGAGRIDEALRLEQRLSEATDPGVHEGEAAYARLWTTVRLSRLKAAAEDDDMRAAVRRRERESGALRDPPALFVALTWPHPDDSPSLYLRHPSDPEEDEMGAVELGAHGHGIWAERIIEREEGDYLFEVRRSERDELRDTEAHLMLVIGPGTEEERIIELPIELTREQLRRRYRLSGETLEEVEIPANQRGQ